MGTKRIYNLSIEIISWRSKPTHSLHLWEVLGVLFFVGRVLQKSKNGQLLLASVFHSCSDSLKRMWNELEKITDFLLYALGQSWGQGKITNFWRLRIWDIYRWDSVKDTRNIQNVNEKDIQEIEGSWGSIQIFKGQPKDEIIQTNRHAYLRKTSPENTQLQPHRRAVCHSEQTP